VSETPAPFAFVESGSDAACRGALDRADALRDDPDALKTRWLTSRVILLDEKGNAYADDDGRLLAPDGQQISEGPGGVGAAVFLGLDPQGTGWFALEGALTSFDAPRRVDLRSAAAMWPAFDASVFAQARALQHWRSRHRYCGVCGGEVALSRAGWQGKCIKCGAEHYPRTDPAVIVSVTDGSRLLLGRQAAWPARRYSVLAGFVEPGETLEQTVAREVLEETGVRVRRCRYLASQPWPFPGSLMLGFRAEAEPDVPQVGDELEEARWFTADDVRRARQRGEWGSTQDDGEGPVLSPGISISRWLIEQWLAEQDGA